MNRDLTQDEQVVKYAGFPKGMNNIAADFELPQGTARNIVNADVLDSGKLRRRKGYTELSSAASHSLWTNDAMALYYSGGALKRWNENDTATSLATGLSDRPISFTEAGLDIYWSNGVDYGRTDGSTNSAWGVEEPLIAPALASASGALPAGKYQALVTFLTAAGEESAASRSSAIDITAGGVTITVPQPASAQVTTVRVYMTPCNDDVFYRIADLDVGVTSLAVLTTPSYGQACRTQFMRRFLPCDLIEAYRGRIYGATSNILWHTEPFMFGLYVPSKNFLPFRAPIKIVKAVDSGLYVAADRTYFLGGAHEEFQPREVLPYGAARNAVARLPRSKDLLWFADCGFVIASENGQVKAVQVENVRPDVYADGAVTVREQDSIHQFLGVVRNPVSSAGIVATDWAEAEVRRKAA